MRTLRLFLVPVGLFSLASCSDTATQFTSPAGYRVSVVVSGSGVDRLRQLSEQAHKGGGDSVVIESGMTAAEEQESADAVAKEIAKAIAAGGTSPQSGDAVPPAEAAPATNSSTGNAPAGNEPAAGAPSGISSGVAAPVPVPATPTPEVKSTSSPFRMLPIEGLGRVAGRVDKFKQACAESLQVPLTKVKSTSEAAGLASDEVLLIVLDRGLSLDTSLQGEALHGVCIFTGRGAVVNINAGNVKLNGVLSYQSGARNTTTFSFGEKGKLEAAIATFSGANNNLTLKSSKISSCSAPVVLKLGAGIVGCQ